MLRLLTAAWATAGVEAEVRGGCCTVVKSRGVRGGAEVRFEARWFGGRRLEPGRKRGGLGGDG